MDIGVTPLSTEEGIELLAAYRNDVHSESGRRAATIVVEWLGGVPFYLSLVGVYMRRNPGLDWQDYANSLEANGLNSTFVRQGAPPVYWATGITETLTKFWIIY